MHICKTVTFDAAHKLDLMPEGHKCRRLHGHTYRVDIVVEGPLDESGIICDYAEIAAAWAPLHDELDHRYLNEIPGLEVPSTEVLAAFIYERLVRLQLNLRSYARDPEKLQWARVARVRVWESSSTYCEAP